MTFSNGLTRFSPLHPSLLSGVTRTVLREAGLPVLMSR